MEPVARRRDVSWMQERYSVSERRACRLVGMDRRSCRYRSRRGPENEQLRQRLRELAEQRRRFGYKRLHVLLRREGWKVNHKRVHRIYVEEKLAVRKRRKWQRLVSVPRESRLTANQANQIWSMDFLSDALVSGRRLRALNIVDEYTREALAIEVDTSLPGLRVVRVLEQLREHGRKPQQIVTDHGPEFAGKVLDQWAHENGVELRFITPGRPAENCYIESFNGRLRDECLNENWFMNLAQAREKIEEWRNDYNQVRPHSALGYRTPEEFAGENQTLLMKEKLSGAPLQNAAPGRTGMLPTTPELSL